MKCRAHTTTLCYIVVQSHEKSIEFIDAVIIALYNNAGHASWATDMYKHNCVTTHYAFYFTTAGHTYIHIYIYAFCVAMRSQSFVCHNLQQQLHESSNIFFLLH